MPPLIVDPAHSTHRPDRGRRRPPRAWPLVLCLLLSAAWPAARAEDAAADAFLAGDFARAQALLEREVARDDVRSSRRLLLARVYFTREDWSRAHDTLQALLQREPGHPEASELLGRALFRLGRHADGLPLYERALSEADQPELRLEYAEALQALGRTTEATAQLKRVVRGERTWPRAHYLLGRIRLAAGLGHWASRDLLVALRLGYPAPDLHYLLAEALEAEGRITGVLQRAGPLPDGEAGRREGETMLVRPVGDDRPGLWHAVEFDTALYQIEEALESGGVPPGADARLLAARAWLAAGVCARAEHYLSQVKGTDPRGELLRADLALAKHDLAAFDKLADRLSALAVPLEERVRRFLDAALQAEVEGRPDEALRQLGRAEAISPGRSDVLRLQAGALTRLGRTDEARARLALLAALHPDSPDLRLLAARHGIELDPATEGSR